MSKQLIYLDKLPDDAKEVDSFAEYKLYTSRYDITFKDSEFEGFCFVSPIIILGMNDKLYLVGFFQESNIYTSSALSKSISGKQRCKRYVDWVVKSLLSGVEQVNLNGYKKILEERRYLLKNLAITLANPVRRKLDYVGISRKFVSVQSLPKGTPMMFDKDIKFYG